MFAKELVRYNKTFMKIHLPLIYKQYATVISAYTPTLTSTEGKIEHFYSDLCSVLRSVPASDKLILLGDFSACVGQDKTMCKEILGKHGVEKTNSNGLFLLSKCAEFELLITNSIFRMANKYKITNVPHHPKCAKVIRTAFKFPSYLHKFQSTLHKKLYANGPLTGNPTEKWNQFRYVL